MRGSLISSLCGVNAVENPELWGTSERAIYAAIAQHAKNVPKDQVFEQLARRIYKLLIGRNLGDASRNEKEVVLLICRAIHKHLRDVAVAKEAFREHKIDIPTPEKSMTRTIYEALRDEHFLKTGNGHGQFPILVNQ